MWDTIFTKLFRFQIFLIFLTFTVSNICLAASGEIRGVVREAESGKPLPGANILIKGTAIGAASDLEGRYIIERVPPGTYTLVFTYMGYQEESVNVQVLAGQIVRQDANLKFKVVKGQEITVTAQLEGQVAAINRQLTSRSIVNVVSAERIQELPDVNASESVGRLPGISIMREGGEGQKVVIRGLAPTYNTVTVGGTKIPSNDLQDRSIDMSMIASDMLAGIEVIKAITPDKDADAFGGIIDFQLAKAKEGGFRSNFRLQSGYNAQQLEYGQYKNSFTISQRFIDDKLGVLITGNMERANRSADIYNAGYSTERERRLDEKFAPIQIDDLKLEDRIETLNRYGGNLMVDYRFDRGEILFSNFLTRLHRNRLTNEQEMDPDVNNDHNYNLELRDISKEIFTSSLAGEYRLPFATIDALVSVNQAVQIQPRNLSYQFTEGSAFDQIIYTQNKDKLGADAILLAAKNNIEDAGLWWARLDNQKSNESDLTSQLNVEIPYNLMKNKISGSLKLGTKFTSKKRLTDKTEFLARLYQETQFWSIYEKYHTRKDDPDFTWRTTSRSNVPSMLNYLDSDFDAGTFLDGDFEFGVSLNGDELSHLADVFIIDSVLSQDELSGLDDFNSHEKVSAGYIMTEINLGPRLMILPGVRYEETYVKFTSKSSSIRDEDILRFGSIKDTVAVHKYGNWFPMLHIRYKLTNWFDIRLAGTRTISRSRLDWLNPRESKRAASQNASRGIIDLKPQISNNFDLFLSFYNYRLGLLTVGGFYKNIEDLIWMRRGMKIFKVDIDEGTFPEHYRGFNLTQPENNPFDTEVYGFEIEWQTNFIWLPKPLDGIVLNANYSQIWSETRYPYSINKTLRVPPFTSSRIDTFRVGPMPNQSDDIANVAIGYDKGGFSARLSMLYQGKTLSSVGNREEIDGFTDALIRWDFMMRQKINKWVSVFGAWNNITNSADQSYIQAIKYADDKEFYGWTADVGLLFNF